MSELNNYTPTPVTREEKILSGANIQPRTRMEYFLKMASENNAGNIPTPTAGDAGKVLLVNSEGQLVLDYPPRDTPVPTSEDAGSVITVNEFGAYVLGNEVPKPTSEDEGKVITVDENGAYVLGEAGSSLPPYTSEDIGKVLSVVEDAVHSTNVTIVPEQSVTLSGPPVVLSNVNEEYFTSEYIGKTAVLAYDNATINLTCISESDSIWYVDDPSGDNVTYFIALNNGDVIFMHADTGTHTISLTMQVPDPAISWQTPSGGGFQIVKYLTPTDAPEPPEGFTPNDYKIYAQLVGNKASFDASFYGCFIDDGSVPILAPTYMHYIENDAYNLDVATKIAQLPLQINPITPPSSGSSYVLTLIAPVTNGIGLNIHESDFLIVDPSNLQWVLHAPHA